MLHCTSTFYLFKLRVSGGHVRFFYTQDINDTKDTQTSTGMDKAAAICSPYGEFLNNLSNINAIFYITKTDPSCSKVWTLVVSVKLLCKLPYSEPGCK